MSEDAAGTETPEDTTFKPYMPSPKVLVKLKAKIRYLKKVNRILDKENDEWCEENKNLEATNATLAEENATLTKKNKDLNTDVLVFIGVAFLLLVSAIAGWSQASDVQAKYDKYRSQYSSNIQYRYLPSETVTVTAYPTPATPTVTPTTTTSSSSSSPTVTPTTLPSSVKGAYSGFPDSVVRYGTTYYYYGIASSTCAYYRDKFGYTDLITWCHQS